MMNNIFYALKNEKGNPYKTYIIKRKLSFPHTGRLPTFAVVKRLFYATNDERSKSKGS